MALFMLLEDVPAKLQDSLDQQIEHVADEIEQADDVCQKTQLSLLVIVLLQFSAQIQKGSDPAIFTKMVDCANELVEHFELLDSLELLPETEEGLVDKLLLIVLIRPFTALDVEVKKQLFGFWTSLHSLFVKKLDEEMV